MSGLNFGPREGLLKPADQRIPGHLPPLGPCGPVSAHPDSLGDLAATLRAFARARDWEQYHTPKNLAMALARETGELRACFQWLTPGESTRIMQDPGAAAAVESELADVLQYLIRLADVLGIDLAKAVRKKVRLNESRFPPNQPG